MRHSVWQLHSKKKKLHKVREVCTLLWFNRKCSISAARIILSYCTSSSRKKGKPVVAAQLTSPPWRTSSSRCPCHRPSTPSCQTEYCCTVYRHGEISLWRQTHAQQRKGQYIHSCKLSNGLRESKMASGRTFLIRFDHSMCQNEKMTYAKKNQMPLLEYVGRAFHWSLTKLQFHRDKREAGESTFLIHVQVFVWVNRSNPHLFLLCKWD